MASISVAPKYDLDRKAYLNLCIVLTLLAAALLTRAGHFGEPFLYYDEDFYLLVADRMWHGALPFVDIWDRKPILLFLIYAALRPLSPDGILAYQIEAMLFATTTAFVIVLIAQRFASLRGAWLAGIAYLLYLPVLRGDGGQSSVFYNLFLALGALEVLRAGESPDARGFRKHALCSMLWAGLAIQVKYTAAIDGCAFGLWLIVLMRRNGASIASVAAHATVWIMVALAPTLLAASVYVLMGHGQEFVQANFLSAFQRHQPEDFPAADVLWLSGMKLAPLLFVALFSLALLMRRRAAGTPVGFLLLWTVFAVVDFFAIGNYFDHYALPLTLPMMVICAPLLETPIGGVAGMAVFGWAELLAMDFFSTATRQAHEKGVAAMVAAARPYAAQGCIYMHDGPVIIYTLTRSCLPTRYAFPAHLAEPSEAGATHAISSMADLIASRPSAIFVVDRPPAPQTPTGTMLEDAITRDYKRVATVPDVIPGHWQGLYARKDLLSSQQDHAE